MSPGTLEISYILGGTHGRCRRLDFDGGQVGRALIAVLHHLHDLVSLLQFFVRGQLESRKRKLICRGPVETGPAHLKRGGYHVWWRYRGGSCVLSDDRGRGAIFAWASIQIDDEIIPAGFAG